MFKFIKNRFWNYLYGSLFLFIAPFQAFGTDLIVHRSCGEVSEVKKILKYKIVSSDQLCEINKFSIPISNSMNCIRLTESQVFAANLNCEIDQHAYRCEATYGCLLKRKAGKISKIVDKIRREGKISHLKQKRNPPKSRFIYGQNKKLKTYSSYQGPNNTDNLSKESKIKRKVASEAILSEGNVDEETDFYRAKRNVEAEKKPQIAISLDD
ncbi:hypothetical protein N9N67_10340 [Bacteriovoracaceae bacterium]|nr:hypothetical protein [Bacteriovoracaceae bacterium]